MVAGGGSGMGDDGIGDGVIVGQAAGVYRAGLTADL